jgi:hypothetical protein
MIEFWQKKTPLPANTGKDVIVFAICLHAIVQNIIQTYEFVLIMRTF